MELLPPKQISKFHAQYRQIDCSGIMLLTTTQSKTRYSTVSEINLDGA